MATTNSYYFQDRTCRTFVEPGFSLSEAIGANIVVPPIVGVIAWSVHRLYYQSQHPAQYAILWSCRMFTFIPTVNLGDFIFGKNLPPLEEPSKKKGEEINPPINYTREIGKIALFALLFIPSVYASHHLAISLGCTILEPWSLALSNTYLPFLQMGVVGQVFGLANQSFEAYVLKNFKAD